MLHVRTRFAPSPTGFLHVGGIRTALFAWLLARQNGGTFILRLEDTDKSREVEGSAQHIQDSLRAIGIDWDEGITVGGSYGPYTQSDRLDIYRAWAQRLIDAGRAYADPYTPDEVQRFRTEARTAKKAFLYRDHRPEYPPVWDGTVPLRFKSEPKAYQWHDEVMGDLHAGPEAVDDVILIKSDGYPTYNFAHIIDDAEMRISHVIRGQEFISSMPNYLALYEALGVVRPVFVHLPHIMNEQGNKKLGKRDGAKDVLDYIRGGYLPETMMSFIATLGWNDGTEQEVFTKSELIQRFSLSRVQRSGARFDEKRLLWMNGSFIRQLDIDELASRAASFWSDSAANATDEYKKQILALVKDRLKTLAELPLLTRYFFEEPAVEHSLIRYNKQLAKLSHDERVELLTAASQALKKVQPFSAEEIQATLNGLLETTGSTPGTLFSLIRIATTWAPFSPQLNDTLAIIGKEATLGRLQRAIDTLE